jgi:TPP-dependent pyruvate/acetoin dehydrogenase alpha subunit
MSQVHTESTPTSLLECMMLIRAFEENNRALQATGKAGGTCTSVGQEAGAVGVVRALRADDLILTNHRSVGHLLARGADPKRILAEILGRRDGYCKGKSGSLHVSVKDLGVILTSTIVGGELSMAPGAALSLSMRDTDAIVACFFGDGAACEGIFHEAVNLAAVWQLPVLFVCENNQWQAYVNRKETMLIDRISDRAAGYGIEGITIDGNDAVGIFQTTEKIVASMRKDRKPVLLELSTYRMRGHFEPDDQAYVNKQELAEWAGRDPIARLTGALLSNGALTPDGVNTIQQRVDQIIAAAVEFAAASPFPDVAELLTDVYA